MVILISDFRKLIRILTNTENTIYAAKPIWLHAHVNRNGKPGLLLYIIIPGIQKTPLQSYWNANTKKYLEESETVPMTYEKISKLFDGFDR